MHQRKAIIIIFVSVFFATSMLLLLDRNKIFSSNNLNTVEAASFKDFSEGDPERTIFEYVELSRQSNLQALESIYCPMPITFQEMQQEKFNEKHSYNTQPKPVYSETVLSDTPSKPTVNTVLNNLAFDFFAKHNPKFIKFNDLNISTISRISLDQDFCQLRINYAAANKPSVYNQDFYLYKNNGKWKIIKIEF